MKTAIFIIKNFKSLLRNRCTPPIYNTVFKLGKLLLAWTSPESAHPSVSHLQVNNVHTPPALLPYTRNILYCLHRKLLGLVLEQCFRILFFFLGLERNHQLKLLLCPCLVSCQCPCFNAQSFFHFILMQVSFPENFSSQQKPAAASLAPLQLVIDKGKTPSTGL